MTSCAQQSAWCTIRSKMWQVTYDWTWYCCWTRTLEIYYARCDDIFHSFVWKWATSESPWVYHQHGDGSDRNNMIYQYIYIYYIILLQISWKCSTSIKTQSSENLRRRAAWTFLCAALHGRTGACEAWDDSNHERYWPRGLSCMYIYIYRSLYV